MNCWLILTSCCKTRRKMLVFDRPSIFPLILVFSILQSTIQPPLSIWYMHKSLVAGCKTRGYTRYSPALFPLLFSWSAVAVDVGAQEQETPDTDHRNVKIPDAVYDVEFPLWPGVVWRFPGRRPRLSIVVDFCASLLKAPLFSRVCTQIPLLPLTLCSRASVFEPSWPLACNIKLVLFYL